MSADAGGSARTGAGSLTVLDVLKRSTDWLRTRGVDSPRLDAEILVAHALGLRRLELYLQWDRPLRDDEQVRARELIVQRGARVPVAYLVGEREFHSLAFFVDPSVLVPRPETELLVDTGVRHLASCEAPAFADVGVGSGCVAVSVLREVAAARAHGIDVSKAALAVAARNAQRHEVADRLTLHEGSVLAPLAETADWGVLDAVLSNPPYVRRDDPEVDPEVREHEPAVAVFVPGDDPLSVAREVAGAARRALRAGGLLALEVGAGSAAAARTMLESMGYEAVETLPDLAGIERVVTGRAPPTR